MPQPVETVEGAAPVHVRIFGTPAVVQLANLPADLVEQANRSERAVSCIAHGRLRRRRVARLDLRTTLHPASLQRWLTKRVDNHPITQQFQKLLPKSGPAPDKQVRPHSQCPRTSNDAPAL